MKILLLNATGKEVVLSINEIEFVLEDQQNLEFDCNYEHTMANIKVKDKRKSSLYKSAENYSFVIFTNLYAVCGFSSENVTFYIGNEVRKFQNHTIYEYYTISCSGAKFYALQYSVTNENEIILMAQQQKQKEKIRKVTTILFTTAIDSVLDFGLICLVLWWIFNLQTAIIAFSVSYAILLLINMICLKMEKSKLRIFNWTKSLEFSDDVDYLIKHINKYCN